MSKPTTPPCPEICAAWRILTAMRYSLTAKLLICDNCIAPWSNRPKANPPRPE